MSGIDYSKVVFSPLEASSATEKYIEEIRANDGDGMPLYIPKLDYDPDTLTELASALIEVASRE